MVLLQEYKINIVVHVLLPVVPQVLTSSVVTMVDLLICANQESTAQSCVYFKVINSDTVNFVGNIADDVTSSVQIIIPGPLLLYVSY